MEFFNGTAPYGGTAPGQLGEVFQLTPPAAAGGAWTETVIHNFGYGGAYAGNPNSLTVASDGTIYGTTYGYDLIGDRGMGSVFELTPPASPDGRWSYRVLQDFGGYHPSPGLILRDGNLYGAVATALQAGNIFEMQPPSTPGDAWTTTYLHQFTDLVPYVDLMDKNGALYGVALTETGEPSLHTIFQLANEVGMEMSAILAFNYFHRRMPARFARDGTDPLRYALQLYRREPKRIDRRQRCPHGGRAAETGRCLRYSICATPTPSTCTL